MACPGRAEAQSKATFTDLTQDWYREAVAWAQENSVVDGMGNNKFAPDSSVTREQLVTILHRLAGSPMGMELMLSGLYDEQYPDSGRIGAWAKPALYWTVYKGSTAASRARRLETTWPPRPTPIVPRSQ